jgi:Dolichyl-phosphate-mannose-protein mannosyltransferase
MSTVLERPVRRLPELGEPQVLRPRGPRFPISLRRPAIPIDVPIVLALGLAVLVVQGVNITGYPAIGDDEGTYLAQAWALQQGVGLAHYTYWYDHPPLGWLQIAALSWIPEQVGPAHLAVATARLIMLPLSLIAVALLYVLSRRLALPRWAAALGAVLFALSPLAATLQRQIYLDNIAVVWMLGAFVLALSPKRHLWHHMAAGSCAAVSILSKETMLVVMPALLIALWQGSHPSTRKFSLVGFLALLGLVGSLYPLYALLNGELFPGADHVSLFGGILFQLQREGSGSFLMPTSAARTIVESWLYYDAFVPLAGIAAALIAIVALRRLRAPALAVLLLLVMAMRPGYLPAMYIIGALPFLAICIAGVLAAGHRVLMSRGPVHDRHWRMTRIVIVAFAATALAGFVGPRWVAGDRIAMTRDANLDYREAVATLAAMPHDGDTKVMVDDAIWLDLIREGYRPGDGAIWFYKIDLDPAVRLENGWRDLDYVVSTPIVRESMTNLDNVTAAMTFSVVVRTFGTGDDRIEIRRVVPS